MVRIVLGLFALAIAGSQIGFAQRYQYQSAGYGAPRPSWSASLTDERQHDFGVVPKASAQKHVFSFVNTLDTELQLTGVRASCGCIKPKVLTPQVKPGETAELLIDFDTKNFDGTRAATATLSLQRMSPYREYSEIQFSIKGVIRRDVVIEPLSLDFGPIIVGTPLQRVATVKYAGNPQWQLLDVKSSNPHIQVEKVETRRDLNSRRIDYQVTVTVSAEHPVGAIQDSLTLTTSDLSNQTLRVPISGHVKLPIQASPIQLGVIDRGEKISKKLIIKGERPFGISEIVTNNARIKFTQPDGEKTLHVLEYTVDTSSDGVIADEIRIVTTDPNQPLIQVPFDAQVVPRTLVKGSDK